MSDDFKIYNRGTGLGQGRDKPGAGLARFKRGRKVGEIVRGAFMRLEAASPGTAWVNLEGEPLLATLPPDLAELAKRIFSGQGVGAMPTGVTEADFPLTGGQQCFFILEALEPEPLLRMLNLGKHSADSPQVERLLVMEQQKVLRRNLQQMPSAQIAARYLQTRRQLAQLLRGGLKPEGVTINLGATQKIKSSYTRPSPQAQAAAARSSRPSPPADPAWNGKAPSQNLGTFLQLSRDRLRAYKAFVHDTPQAAALQQDLMLYSKVISSQFRQHGLLAFRPLLWLTPEWQSEAAFFKEDPTGPTTFILQSTLPGGDLLELSGSTAAGGVITRRQLPPGSRDILALLLSKEASLAGSGISLRA